MILLNPGPVNLSARVRQALVNPDLCHRESEFSELQNEIRARLLAVYALDEAWAAVLVTGSGTAAVEAMIASLVPDTGHLLVLENGVYGERMSAIAKAHRINRSSLQHPWQAPLDLDRIKAKLVDNPQITHVAMVHHETTTGRLNRLAEVSALCKARGVGLLVDAVSSFGAEQIDFGGIAACAATANKCLHGAPGVSFVMVRRDVLRSAARRSLYLDLANYCAEQDNSSTPFTPSIPVFYALHEALIEFEEQGGWRSRHRRYRELIALARDGLITLGVEPLLPFEDTSVVLNAFRLPPGMSYLALHDGLKGRGFVIYAGQGAFARTLFRISTMGTIDRGDVERLVAAVQQLNGSLETVTPQ